MFPSRAALESSRAQSLAALDANLHAEASRDSSQREGVASRGRRQSWSPTGLDREPSVLECRVEADTFPRMSDTSRLPDFIAVGPQRTGTTWVHEVLKPHLGLPRGIKETDFFLKNYAKGMQWYLEFFRGYPPQMLLGEVDPNYFGEDVVRERIEKDIPGAKIVVTLRDPVER